MNDRREIHGLRGDGTEFPAAASVSRHVINGERVFTVLLQDITQRKEAERALLSAKEDAERANRAKSDFLASVSHELRTPLNAILGFAEILRDEYFGAMCNDRYREYAADIKTSGEHLLSLVNDILDLSAIEAGKHAIAPENQPARTCMSECLKIVETKARGRKIRIAADIPAASVTVYADRRAVRQVLLNILSNAVKFTPVGGRIVFSGRSDGAAIRFIVSDNGPGIPRHLMARVLDPFERAVREPYLSDEGWGLGLAISKSLVDAHGGEMMIESEVGEGTEVTVIFPNRNPAP